MLNIWLSNMDIASPICLNIGFLLLYSLHQNSEMTYHRLHVHWKCSLSPLDRIGSMTTYGNSKSIPDKACRLFHNGAIGWMDEF